MDVPLAEWIGILDSEYARSYVPAGGSTVKFAIANSPAVAEDVRQELAALARRYDLACFGLDGGSTRIHMIDQVFHAVARQIDWDALAGNLMRRLLSADGYVMPPEIERCTYPEIAVLNGTSETELRRRVRVLLHEHVEQDYALVHEFRNAMLRLCQARLEASRVELTEIDNIHAWLRGELRLVSVLRPAGIYQRIGRNLARDMFLSLAHWLRMTGQSGCILILDISRYALERRFGDPDGLFYHSSTAVIDAYEVLRQFIDGTDELEGCLIVVLAPTAFLTDEKRGLAKYLPLKFRIWDDVRDRTRPNPLASLVRVAAAGV